MIKVALDCYDIQQAYRLADDVARQECNNNDASDYYLELSLVKAELQSKRFGEQTKWVYTFEYSTEGKIDAV